MFGIESSYYNQSIRKLVIAFGSLFNQTYVSKFDANDNIIEQYRVPITYGPKEKFVRKIKEDHQITDNRHVQITLPRVGFDMTTILYDPARKINKLQKVKKTENGTEYSMWSAVPYVVNFGVYVFTRNITDNLQIIEQILPQFSPDFTVSLNFNKLSEKVDVPIILNSVNTTEDYEGDFSTRRLITTVFDFSAKFYIYGQIKEKTANISKSIETVDIDFFDLYKGSTASSNNFITSFGWTGDSVTRSVTPTNGNNLV
jgi:hypothetical protein